MARRKGPRRPDADELALWRQVARTATPLKALPSRPDNEADRAEPIVEPSKRHPVKEFRVGSLAPAAKPETRIPVSEPPRMDGKLVRKLTRGKLTPEARIDLHGMTQDQAHLALESFILRSWNAQRRLVLVITGKGRDRDGEGPIPERGGVLRMQVPRWLRQGQLALAVLDLTPAHRRHGGDGAFYVYLRRNR